MADYPTPHINAAPEDFGKVVLMPGDPLRSEFIAKTYLTEARLVNNVRGVQGYTGKWNGETVSVMASGMGMPSIGIYSYELFEFFGVFKRLCNCNLCLFEIGPCLFEIAGNFLYPRAYLHTCKVLYATRIAQGIICRYFCGIFQFSL